MSDSNSNLKKMKFGQYIREVGPKSHQSKTGTPTMGGMIILAGVIVTSLIFMIVEKNTKISTCSFYDSWIWSYWFYR